MAIHHWPQCEQPREKLLYQGTESLSDAELLAIFLRTGIKGKSAVDLGRELLTHFGGLRAALDAEYSELCTILGIGLTKYTQFQAALELGRRYLQAQVHREAHFNNPMQTKQFVTSKLRHQSQEIFACLFLDTQHRMICFEELAQGTLDHAIVYPREIVKRALKHNAGAVILSHNHPSGVAKPSLADKQLTHVVRDALALIGTEVLDHLIVGEEGVFSFAEQGLI